jgi:cysteine-rich repeat protein
MTPLIASGTCHGGACFENQCGNLLLDQGEACDDGNQMSNDSCSGDCSSNETCGNGVTDGIKFEQCDDGNFVDHDGCDSKCRLEVATWSQLSKWTNYDAQWIDTVRDFNMAYDEARGVMVLFGGVDPAGIRVADTWLWTGADWIKAHPKTSPEPRYAAAMTYDTQRQRVVLFGGETTAGMVSDTWEFDGQDWILRPVSNGPGPCKYVAMAYDPVRKVSVLYGGFNGSFDARFINYALIFDGTWEWDGTAWKQNTDTQQAVTDPHPGPRFQHAMAYDPKRGRIVLYGGFGGTPGTLSSFAYQTTTFEYTSQGKWQKIDVPPPTESATVITYDHALAWDPISERVILAGGRDSGGNAHPWSFAWNGSTWTRVADSPRLRAGYALATDVTSRRIVAFGGETSNPTLKTTNEWNGAAWLDVTPPTHAKSARQVAVDTHRGVAVMYDDDGNTWEFNGWSWKALSPAASPPARASAASTYDAARREVLVFGGGDDSAQLQDTWAFDGTTWRQVATAGPSPRRGASMAYDAARMQVVLHGGKGGVGATELADTWLWNGTAWQEAPASATPDTLGAYFDEAIAYDPIRQQVVLFGGYKDTGVFVARTAQTHVWNGTAWSVLTSALIDPPVARRGAGMAWDPTRRRMVLYGGEGPGGLLQDTWELEWEPGGPRWNVVSTNTLPNNRYNAALFSDPRGAGLTLIGRYVGNETVVDTWQLRWRGVGYGEACREADEDQDGDGAVSCADVDCWARCAPACPPGTSCAVPGCGDGTCGASESCRLCPTDCGSCTPVCGDAHCDPGEACIGDCSP